MGLIAASLVLPLRASPYSLPRSSFGRRRRRRAVSILVYVGFSINQIMSDYGSCRTGSANDVWGTLNSAIPVAWSTWLSKGIRDEPESGGGLMVGTIQLAIMLGAGFGGLLLDHLSIAAPFIGSAVLLAIASVAVGGAHPPRD